MLALNLGQADRLSKLPPYLFVEIDRKKKKALEAGRDVVDFGVGDPDGPTPGFIVDRMSEVVGNPANHSYASGKGLLQFRQTVAEFFARRFGVTLDPSAEVLPLLGSKEGIGHLPLAVINPGDTVLVPDPGYPVYTSATILADGVCHSLPLREEHGWLPDLDGLSPGARRNAKLMYLNYPNNPTAACATLSFFRDVVNFACEYQIPIAHDAAYSELYFADSPPSILQVDGAKEIAIEFHSLSKTFNMTGWRIAFAVGNAELIAALARVKSNLDSGMFQALQEAGIEALKGIERQEVQDQLTTYRGRRDLLVNGLREAGWNVKAPQATFYVWAKCPQGYDSRAVASRLLDQADVVAIPGIGFGRNGDGFVRFALTVSQERTREAVRRLSRVSW